MGKMKKIYEDNSFIVIPKVYKNSDNIIVMSYEEGKFYEDMNLSDYQKFKIITLLRLYLNSSSVVDNFIHTDLHNGNWKVRKHPLYNNVFQIVLLDFGLCAKLHDPDFVKTIHECFETDNYRLCLKTFIEFNKDLNKLITFEKVFDKFKEEYEYYINSKKIDLNKIIKFFVKNNYRLCNNLFNICITTAICEYHFRKYMPNDFNNSVNKHYEVFSSMITFCKTYNCFDKYCKILENKFEKINKYYMFNLKDNEISKIKSDSELDTDSDNELDTDSDNELDTDSDNELDTDSDNELDSDNEEHVNLN
jgi:predicted unusual protein kinase regulating ubiquinone biosynthesis (AarF/ABC1/UbiB family)